MTSGLSPADLRFDPPDVDPAVVAAVALDQYGVTGGFTRLRGECDHNTLITTADGRQYVLKIASPSEAIAATEFQCDALDHIADVDPALAVPRVVPTIIGERHTTVTVDGATASARMLTYLPGITFDGARKLSLPALRGVGAFQGRLARALRWYRHRAATNFMAWNLAAGLVADDVLWAGLTPASAVVAEPCRGRVERATRALGGMRAQVVHNDGHRGNLLRKDDRSTDVVGVIDFGDLVHTALVADLAICAASFLDRQPDQPAALAALAAGYHEWTALLDDEIELLADLTLARMVLSTLLVEYQTQHTPHIAADVAAELPGLLVNIDAWQRFDGRDVARLVRAGLGRSHR